ncbi:unnamed protein product [Penicillium egyptiacum]|uniref:DUF7587 domain-containing protein n=1 Tax=Penicillium egyptiacum TaxID=1303716 RepID=A0A9W4KIH3_9EURO|nr:unnamed protein product [Penicillium egyptiacum]
MDCAQDGYFYRCYSNRSAGELRSGKYHDGHLPLTKEDRLHEFNIHRDRNNKQPTALVSVTDRPLEALHRALAKYYDSDEDPGRIWIVIIRVPDGADNNGPRHAGSLAQQINLDADIFQHEYVFEWEIPQQYVEHVVSVRTLLGRRIGRIIDLGFPDFRTTRDALVKGILDSDDAYGTGRLLGSLAQAFGTGTYTYEIALQTLQNCLSVGKIDEDHQYVHYGGGLCRSLGFNAICSIELGIQDQLDW